jgi:hypothetical protein
MNRREFLKDLALTAAALPSMSSKVLGAPDADMTQDWLARWEKNILGVAGRRYCDKETGEELGWLVSPFLNGFYYGYLATRDPKWVEMLIDWTDSCIRRGIKEPDGFLGWPKSGMDAAESLYTDSLLGEAMTLRPVVLMADEILKAPALKDKFGPQAQAYLKLAEQVFEKWDSRGCWREVPDGGLWVVPLFGIDPKTGNWTEGYARRSTDGFSNPANKENHIARWLLAMYDVTKKPVYRERAEKWFRLVKSRMKTREGGKYCVWNYWDPAGPWDYKANGSPKHWVGVHPNGGYYGIDVEAIVTAFEHGLVFTKDDIQRLIATNRDFMWNQQVAGAKFQRIDGGQPNLRWRNSPGTLWMALVPHDETLRKIFLANHNPSGWGGLSATPWFLARETPGAPGTLWAKGFATCTLGVGSRNNGWHRQGRRPWR